MSSIGPASFGAINLAGSLAGAQRNSADTDQVKEGAAERKLQSDLKALAARSIGDVGEADQSGDRDADGRLPWQLDDPHETTSENEPANPHRLNDRAGDPDGSRGLHLDLEA